MMENAWFTFMESIRHHILFKVILYHLISLQWRHKGCDGVSNQQPHHCLPNSLFRRRSQKTLKLRVTGLCEGNSPVTGEFPHKGPVTREMFPFDGVIMFKATGHLKWILLVNEISWIWVKGEFWRHISFYNSPKSVTYCIADVSNCVKWYVVENLFSL